MAGVMSGSTCIACSLRCSRLSARLRSRRFHTGSSQDGDASRIAVGGFSGGASYAISLGLINGDLFKRVTAFSPGFVIDGAPQGKPRFFISHGTRDRILPIDRCGRSIAADLKSRGYDTAFREFDGGHEIPGEVMREALRWIRES